jgi:hypothetical protein
MAETGVGAKLAQNLRCLALGPDSCLSPCFKNLVQPVSGLAVHPRKDVRIGRQSDSDSTVAQHLTDQFHRKSKLMKHDCGAAMPEPVWSDMRQFCLLTGAIQVTLYVFWGHRIAVDRSEQQII